MTLKRTRVGLVVSLAAVAVAVALPASSGATQPAVLYHTVDTGLCAFPFEATGVGAPRHHVTPNVFFTNGPFSVTLRSLVTRATASLSSPAQGQFDPGGATFSFIGRQLIFSSDGIPIGFLDGRTVMDLGTGLIVQQTGSKGAQSPCRLLGAPPVVPRTTAAPWPLPQDPVGGMQLAGLTPLIGAALAEHIHAHLTVLVNGAPVTVPAGIGLGEPFDQGGGFFESSDAVFSPLHTHTADGIIHVEADSPPFALTLGQFFAEWQVRLTPSCLGAYCSGAGSTVRAYVGGLQVADPRSIALTDHADIVVVFGPPGVPPTLPVYSGPWPS
jgi:hypothetical protein